MRRSVAAFLILLLLALSGCGSIVGPESATLGSAKPTGETPVKVKPGEILKAKDWPDACQLVDDDEVKAVLPEAAHLDKWPGPVWTTSIEQYTADSEYTTDVRADEGRCLYAFDLPGEHGTPSRLWWRIEAIADPALITKYFDRRAVGSGGYEGIQAPAGVDACYLSAIMEGDYVCRKGPVMFALGGHTTATFNGLPDASIFSFWRDRVLPHFATNIGTKIR